MEQILKYPFDTTGEFELMLPPHAPILSVQVQKGKPCMWVAVHADTKPVLRKFRFFGTGHPIDSLNGLIFVATFQMKDGDLVFHLFEDRTVKN